MSKEDLIEQVREGYCPDWEPAPTPEEVVQDIETLYALPVDSIEYLELKAHFIGYMARNCIEQLERGKREQGILTRKMLEGLLLDLSRRKER